MAKHPQKMNTFDQQSRVVPGPERIHVSELTTGNELVDLPPDPSVTTLYENLQRVAKKIPDGEFLGERSEAGRRKYGWLKYDEVLNRSQRIGSALIKLGIQPGENTKIGICGITCSEWIVSTYAAMAYSMVVVPVYHNYHQEALTYIINSCNIPLLFCDTKERIENFLDTATEMPCLKFMVQMRGSFIKTDAALNSRAESQGIKILDFDYLLKLGDSNLVPVQPPKPENLYIICHTSGTTGTPKGVMLTHKAMVANMGSVLYFFDKVVKNQHQYGQDKTYFSFLPMAHIYEQCMQSWLIYCGVRIGFYSGDVQNLVDDMQELKPTLTAMVPRVLNKIHAKIEGNVAQAGYLKRYLYKRALTTKMNLLDASGTITKSTIWDKIVFGKIQAIFGGKIEEIFCGGAPVSPDILRYFRAAFGCVMFEGYGQTEVAAAATITLPGDTKGGHVGGPFPGFEVKLIDVPDMEYFSKDDKGEILLRSTSSMLGYFHQPEITRETLDSDGWIHTGDIGTWLPNGGLRIIDRKKHFFKLAQGEYISPEVVENAYQFCPLVSQVYVDGQSLKPFLVAIVVPELDQLKAWALKEGVISVEAVENNPELEELCNNKKVRQGVLTEIRIVGAERGLHSLEQVKAVHLTTEPFTNENRMLTPTMKLRRAQMRKLFADVIDELYKEVEGTV